MSEAIQPASQAQLEAQVVKKLNANTFLAYALVRGDRFIIERVSNNFNSFIGYTDTDVCGMQATDVFYEFVGSEDTILQVMQGTLQSFQLEYVARTIATSGIRYYTIEVIPYAENSDALLLFLLDTTVSGRLQQRLTQERNELSHEVQKHEVTQIQLKEARDNLSEKVHAQTAELESANAELVRQIKERRQIEAELLHIQKMKAIGELAGGLAHDFNNWLTIINTYSELLMRRYPDDETIMRYANYINDAGKQAHSQTKQLLTFSHKQIANPTVLNLNEEVEEVNHMVERIVGDHINITANLSHGLNMIRCDVGQIQQVLMNLVFNARDAMPDGGDLIISTTNVAKHELAANVQNSGDFINGAVQLKLADTGSGMSAETIQRVFEPFFTTKGIGKGTGLGLSTVYGIIKQVGGHIQVQSDLNQGTTFDLFFPIAHPDDNDAENPVVLASAEANPEKQDSVPTILVVDDEPIILELVTECLAQDRYHVLVASSGKEAISLVQKADRPIDLVLTDVIMPNMNGKQLIEQLQKTVDTPFSIIYMSGYSNEIITQQDILLGQATFLQKPFTTDKLLNCVSDQLALPLR